jgi:hypothetical protein
MTHMQEGAARIAKHSSENIMSMTNWVQETKQWLVEDYIEPSRKSFSELANAIEQFINELNGICEEHFVSLFLSLIHFTDYFVALPEEIESYFMSLEEVKLVIHFYEESVSLLDERMLSNYISQIKAALNE